MAELSPGKKPLDCVLRPGPGQFTVTDLAKLLGCAEATIKKTAKQLGIEIGPFVREEKYLRRVYKHRLRWLNTEEARAIITRARILQSED